jgi:hypothetical protein
MTVISMVVIGLSCLLGKYFSERDVAAEYIWLLQDLLFNFN